MSRQPRPFWIIIGLLMVLVIACAISAAVAGAWFVASGYRTTSPGTPLPTGTIDSDITGAPTLSEPTPTVASVGEIPIASDWFVLGKGAIRLIELSPNRELLAVASGEYLYVYDSSSYQELWRIPTDGPIKQINQLRWSPDSRYLAVDYFYDFEQSRTVIWDIEQREEEITLQGQPYGVAGYAWSPDGRQLASLANNGRGSLVIWNIETRDVLYSSSEDYGAEVAWSADGGFLVHNSANSVIVRSSETYEVVAQLDVDNFFLSSSANIALSNSSDTDQPGVLVWDIATGRTLHRLLGMIPVASSWSPDGSSLVVLGDDKKLHVVDASTGEILTTGTEEYPRERPQVMWAQSSSQLFIATANDDQTQSSLSEWNLDDALIRSIGETTNSPISRMLWLEPDERLLVFLEDEIQEVNIQSEQFSNVLQDHIPAQLSAVWSSDGHTIASSGGGRIFLWDVPSRALRLALDTQETTSSVVNSLAYHPDGIHLAAFTPWNTVTIWNTRTGDLEQRLSGAGVSITYDPMWHSAITWSSDGQYLAVGFAEHLVIWDAESWQRHMTLALPEYAYPSVISFSSDNKLIAYGWEGDLYIASLETGENINLLEGVYGFYWLPEGEIMALSRSLNGARLWGVLSGESGDISFPMGAQSRSFGSFNPSSALFAELRASSDRFTDWEAIVWNLSTGMPMERLPLQSVSDAPHIDWSSDGEYIVLPSQYGNVIVWTVSQPGDSE